MTHWVMVVDLRKCIGCGTCKHVCSQLSPVPPDANWREIVEQTIKTNPGVKRFFVPTSCMHCENPPCLDVCPSKATKRRKDGIVYIDPDRCIGCYACIVACPYNARSVPESASIFVGSEVECQMDGTQRSKIIRTSTKCDFCRDRVVRGIESGLKVGTDFEATPFCVYYCISEALYFGDMDDPNSEVSKLISENKTVRLREDLMTNPSVYYIVD